MSLPTKSNLLDLSYAFCGQPFADCPANNSIILTDLSYAWLGRPFVRNPADNNTVPLRLLLGVGL